MAQQHKGKARILIVDDEPSARDTVEALLFREGYELTSIASGQEVLARLDEPPPDAILLDVMMPGMDGLQICQILKTDQGWQHTPIVLITALDSKEDLVRGLDAGADDFIAKPISGPELRARLRSMLRIKRQYDLLEAQRQELETAVRVRDELTQATAQHLQELELLHKAGLRMMNSLDADYIVEQVCLTALEMIPHAAHCVMHFLSDDVQCLADQVRLASIVFSATDRSKSIQPTVGTEDLIRHAIERKEAYYVPDLLAEPHGPPSHGRDPLYEMRALLVNPLLVDRRCIGTLSIDSPKADAFGIAHRRILSILANQAAVVLMKVRLFEELERISNPETGDT